MRTLLPLLCGLLALTAPLSTTASPSTPYDALMACHFAQMHLQQATASLKKNNLATTRQLASDYLKDDPLMRIASPGDRAGIGRLVNKIIDLSAGGRPDEVSSQLCPTLTAYARNSRLDPALHTAGCIQQVRLMAELYDKAQSLGGGKKGIRAVADSLNQPLGPSAMWRDLQRRGINPRLLTQMSLALTSQLAPVTSNQDLQLVTQSLMQQCNGTSAVESGTQHESAPKAP